MVQQRETPLQTGVAEKELPFRHTTLDFSPHPGILSWVEMVAPMALAEVNNANEVFITTMAKRFSIDNPEAPWTRQYLPSSKLLLPTIGRFSLGWFP
jgi:hypothetical protein